PELTDVVTPLPASSGRDYCSKVLARPGLSTILVVDDDADTRVMLRLILEPAGHEVVEASDGHTALGLIGPDPLPDLITTDLRMPIVNGQALIERLRSEPRTAGIPIVVV